MKTEASRPTGRSPPFRVVRHVNDPFPVEPRIFPAVRLHRLARALRPADSSIEDPFATLGMACGTIASAREVREC